MNCFTNGTASIFVLVPRKLLTCMSAHVPPCHSSNLLSAFFPPPDFLSTIQKENYFQLTLQECLALQWNLLARTDLACSVLMGNSYSNHNKTLSPASSPRVIGAQLGTQQYPIHHYVASGSVLYRVTHGFIQLSAFTF